MSSGVAFRETYDGSDDSAALGRALLAANSRGPEKSVAMFDTREVPAATRFHYAGAETEVLGLVIANAVKMSLAAYTQSRIWQPLGAEADAMWAIDGTGHEVAYCCFTATLRDWARLALMLAHDGEWNGKQIVPRQWLLDATTVAPGDDYLAPRKATRFYGYGYQLWIFPGAKRQFALLGIHGHAIFVDPESKLVLVHTAVREKPTGDPGGNELIALWQALAGGGRMTVRH